MLRSEQFIRRSIKDLLIKDGAPEAVAVAATDHAIEYGKKNGRADFDALLREAKWYAKHNRAASAPSVKREIQQARLPSMPKWYVGQ